MGVKHVVSFSGGRTSAYLVHLMEKNRTVNGWDVDYVFMDTGAEHPKTYEFVRRVVREWGVPLTCLRVEYNEVLGKGNSYVVVSVDDIGPDLLPWQGMLTKYGAPGVQAPFCTARMKTEPFVKYCTDVFGKDGFTTWLGIRADEPKRLVPRQNMRYLADISDFEKADVLAWWREQPFDLGIEEHLGNCVFCVKKGLNKIALAGKDEPVLAKQFTSLLEDNKNIRQSGRKYNHVRIYRKGLLLSEVLALYADADRDELYRRTRFSKQFETGSCSESCEAFSDEVDISDLI